MDLRSGTTTQPLVSTAGTTRSPDQVAILVILPDGTQMNGEESASADQ
jgi:hypothetical protein